MDATVGPIGLAPAELLEHRPRIYRYLLRMARDPYTADDLTQETFLRALRAVQSLREPAALLSWLYRLATNVFLDRVRAQGRRRLESSQEGEGADPVAEIPDPGPRVDRLVEQAEMSRCVREFVDELPDDYRAAVLLHDAHGLSSREISELLGVSVATAKIRIHRGRARLRTALQEGCEFEPDERGVTVCEPVTSTPLLPPLQPGEAN